MIKGIRRAGRRGASLTSYGLLVGLVAIVALVSITNIGGNIDDLFTETADTLDAAVTGSGGAGASPAPSGDQQPDAFAFADATSAAKGVLVYSDIVQITGHDGVAISISGAGSPEFRVCADATCSGNPGFTASTGSVADGEYVQLRLISASTGLTARSATLTAGQGSSTWTVIAQDWGPGDLTAVDVGAGYQIRCTHWNGTQCQGPQLFVPVGAGIDDGWWNLNNANSTDGQTACETVCQLVVQSAATNCQYPFPASTSNPNPGRRMYFYASGSVTLDLPSPASDITPTLQTHTINNQAVTCNW